MFKRIGKRKTLWKHIFSSFFFSFPFVCPPSLPSSSSPSTKFSQLSPPPLPSHQHVQSCYQDRCQEGNRPKLRGAYPKAQRPEIPTRDGGGNPVDGFGTKMTWTQCQESTAIWKQLEWLKEMPSFSTSLVMNLYDLLSHYHHRCCLASPSRK